jgi:hypothetical protein
MTGDRTLFVASVVTCHTPSCELLTMCHHCGTNPPTLFPCIVTVAQLSLQQPPGTKPLVELSTTRRYIVIHQLMAYEGIILSRRGHEPYPRSWLRDSTSAVFSPLAGKQTNKASTANHIRQLDC